MSQYAEFAERERLGWADAGTAQAYATRFGPVVDIAAKNLAARAGGPGIRALDLCCGQGTLTAMLAASGAIATGLDFSQAMLGMAAKAAPDAKLQQGDAADMPFGDADFDHVVCNFGIMHLPDQPHALREIRRVVREGGTFAMATWFGPDVSPAFATILGAIRANADLSAAPAQPDLFAFANRLTASDMLGRAGFELTDHLRLETAWELRNPEELFEIFQEATVGVAMLLKSQSSDAVEAIRAETARTVSGSFAEGDGYLVPVPIAIVTARAV